MTQHQDPTPFDLLLGELQGVMTPDAFERVRVVFSSWSGQQVSIPAPRRWLFDAAEQAAQRMRAQGVPAPLIRDRLVGMGVKRRMAYLIIKSTRQEARHDTA